MDRYKIGPYRDEDENAAFAKEDAYLRAKKKLDRLVGFYWHLASYVVVNIVLILIIGFNNDAGFWTFGTFSTAFFWGIGLGFHFLGVFGPNLMFGKKWEKRKLKEYMDKEEQRWE